jgi:hypothetical protein
MQNWYSPKQQSLFSDRPRLKPDTLEKAKKFAPGYDIYVLKERWLEHWANKGKRKLGNPDGAFINFCRKQPPIY